VIAACVSVVGPSVVPREKPDTCVVFAGMDLRRVGDPAMARDGGIAARRTLTSGGSVAMRYGRAPAVMPGLPRCARRAPRYRTSNWMLCGTGSPVTVNVTCHVPLASPVVFRL
jgi:hypothetical protein